MATYPVFSAPYYQKGFGVPPLFLRTFKLVKPFLKRIGLKALKHGIRLGARVTSDVGKSENFKKSLKRRSTQALNEVMNPADHPINYPNKKKPITKRLLIKGRKATKEKDIFDK